MWGKGSLTKSGSEKCSDVATMELSPEVVQNTKNRTTILLS